MAALSVYMVMQTLEAMAFRFLFMFAAAWLIWKYGTKGRSFQELSASSLNNSYMFLDTIPPSEIRIVHSIAIIHTQYGPYHLARAHALTNVFPGSVDLIQLAAKENQRQWIVEENSLKISTIAPGVLESYSKKQLINGLIYHLKQNSPSALVVAGYSEPAMRAAILWGKKRNIPVILLSDSQLCDRPRNFFGREY